jgi:hypothetical protein
VATARARAEVLEAAGRPALEILTGVDASYTAYSYY